MKKLVTALMFATVAGALTFGAAATLTVNADNLGSGGSPVEACQESVSVGFSQVENEPQLINGIIVSGVLPACAGQTLSYIVSDEGSLGLVSDDGLLTGEASQTFLFPVPEEGDGNLLASVIGEVGITIAGAAPLAPPIPIVLGP